MTTKVIHATLSEQLMLSVPEPPVQLHYLRHEPYKAMKAAGTAIARLRSIDWGVDEDRISELHENILMGQTLTYKGMNEKAIAKIEAAHTIVEALFSDRPNLAAFDWLMAISELLAYAQGIMQGGINDQEPEDD